MKGPNVVFVFVDDLGYGDVSCLNKESKVQTKNIDALAKGGTIFTDGHTCSSLCTPSRYGLLTGRYAWRGNLKWSVLPASAPPLIEKERKTFGHIFKEAGYQTAVVGKWHLGLEWEVKGDYKQPKSIPELSGYDIHDKLDFEKPLKFGPKDHGFDYSFIMPASLDQPPLVYIENHKVVSSKPDRIVGTPGFIPVAKGATKPVKDSAYGLASAECGPIDAVPTMHNKVLSLIDQYAKGDKPFFIYSPTPAVHGPLAPTKEFEGKSGIGPYGDMILMVDDFVGKIEQKLKDNGIADNTMIVFTSDNGCAPIVDMPMLIEKYGHNSSGIFRGCKFDIWEGGHRVPLIVKWPSAVKAGAQEATTVCLTDFFATFAEMTGIKYGDDAGEDSYSMLSLFKGAGKYNRADIIHHSGAGMFSIRKGNWKLEFCSGSGGLEYFGTGRKDGMNDVQLYDLSKDISEKENVYDKHPEVIAEFRALLLKYLMDGRSTPGAPQKNASPAGGVWPGLQWLNAGY